VSLLAPACQKSAAVLLSYEAYRELVGKKECQAGAHEIAGWPGLEMLKTFGQFPDLAVFCPWSFKSIPLLWAKQLS